MHLGGDNFWYCPAHGETAAHYVMPAGATHQSLVDARHRANEAHVEEWRRILAAAQHLGGAS